MLLVDVILLAPLDLLLNPGSTCCLGSPAMLVGNSRNIGLWSLPLQGIGPAPAPGAEQDTAHDLGVRTRHCPKGGMLALLTVQWSSPARSRCQVEAQLTLLLLQQICMQISALVEWMISHPCSRLKEKDGSLAFLEHSTG